MNSCGLMRLFNIPGRCLNRPDHPKYLKLKSD